MSSDLSSVGNQASYGAGSYSRSSNTCTRFTKYCAETRIAKGLRSIYRRVVGSPNPALPANVARPIIRAIPLAADPDLPHSAAFRNECDEHKGEVQSPTRTSANPELSQDPVASSSTTPSKWPLLPKVSLEQVSEFLTADELGRVIPVCKNWASMINRNNFIWNRQAQRVGVINPQIQAELSGLNRYQSDGGERFNPQALRMISEYYDGNVIENAKQTFANPHPAIAFGREEYIRWGIGDPGEAPPLPSNIHEILQSPCPFWPGKTIEETHTLVLIPQTITRIVDGRPVTVPLTLRTLDQLLKSSNNGADVRYRYIWDKILEEHGFTPVEKSHWVLMTSDVVPGSRNQDYPHQKQLVEDQGYEVPGILDAATSILLERIRSGRRLFSDNPSTYTRCQQTVRGYQSVVGGFTPGGLHVTDGRYDNEDCGVAGLRKF